MAVFIYFKHQDTVANLEINRPQDAVSEEGVSPSLPSTQESTPGPLPQPAQPVNLGQHYSPVAIILATCALVTAIGKALRPTGP